jgi:3-dehydroquinate dehydratase-1
MSTTKSPKIPWRKPCLRVGTISTKEGLALLRKNNPEADLIEVRIDSLYAKGLSSEDIIPYLEKRVQPVLLTLRTTLEGGHYPWKSRERQVAYRALMPHAEAIDMELTNVPLLGNVLKEARAMNKSLIISSHSPTRKLTRRKLERLVNQFRKRRATVYKIAGLTRTPQDIAVLAEAMLKNPLLRFALMGIGPRAAVSRVVLPALGSKLAYGYLDVPAAKNQPSLTEVNEGLKSIGLA